MRDCLVYIPCDRGKIVADLFRGDRSFDIALNDYTGQGVTEPRADHRFAMRGHKWPCIFELYGDWIERYEAVCFLDDDIAISAEQMDWLFHLGRVQGWEIWQAALTPDSFYSHQMLVAREGSQFRHVQFVEIMMPCFSRHALRICRNTFNDSSSGWGLDFVWPKLLGCEGVVVDSIAAKHTRPVQSGNWISPEGLRPEAEMQRVLRKYGVCP